MSATPIDTVTPGDRRRPKRLPSRAGAATHVSVGVAALFLALLMGATTAFAYWHSAGFGIGAATTGTLAAPTAVTVPSTSDSSVSINWAASAGGTSPTGYYVTRTTDTTTGGACGSSLGTLIMGTSCTDTNVPDGAHTYRVTAVYRSWTASGTLSSTVTVVTPTQVVFTTAPTDSSAGAAITPSIAVTVQSAEGIPVPTADITVIVAIGTNPAAGALSGTTTALTDSTGVAIFPGLSINKAGAGYTLTAVSAGLSPATSPAFTVTAAAASTLEITSSAFSGAASASASLGPLTVGMRDAFGNVAIAPPGGTTLALSSDSAGAAVYSLTQSGAQTASVTIPAGSSAVSFYYGDTKAGGPAITVSGTGLASASQTQTITAGTAAKLLFGQQPTNTTNGNTITPAVTALIVDQFGNQTSSTASVTIAIANNAGSALSPGILSGTLSRNAVGGVATFNNLSIDGALGIGGTGNGYTLRITSGSFAAVISNPFNIT